MKQKVFVIIFEKLSIVRNCIRHNSGPLKSTANCLNQSRQLSGNSKVWLKKLRNIDQTIELLQRSKLGFSFPVLNFSTSGGEIIFCSI